jgi:hypothetical protein
MTWVAVAIGGSALIGGATSLISSGQQAGAANNATDNTRQQFEETRADYAPWRDAGKLALSQQTDLLGLNGADKQTNAFTQFRADPGYNYTVDQAVQGVDRSAAARGLLTSGATIKAIQDRAANLADQGYGNYFNRLARCRLAQDRRQRLARLLPVPMPRTAKPIRCWRPAMPVPLAITASHPRSIRASTITFPITVPAVVVARLRRSVKAVAPNGAGPDG